MLRLEAEKPNAAAELCRSLRQAWVKYALMTESKAVGLWLMQATPICLEMIANNIGKAEAKHG